MTRRILRSCAFCGGAIPARRRINSRYCTIACRQAAESERRKASYLRKPRLLVYSDAQVRDVRARHVIQGVTLAELSEETGMSLCTLSVVVRGLSRREAGGPVRESRFRRVIRSPAEKDAIRAEVAAGRKQAAVAAAYRISQGRVSVIARSV